MYIMAVVGSKGKAQPSQGVHVSVDHETRNTVRPQPRSLIHAAKEKWPSSQVGKHYFVDEEYLVTAFVPSETACFASSPGRISRTLRTHVRTWMR